jgi:hypothetical protein
MRFNLRTLLIVLALVPPTFAFGTWGALIAREYGHTILSFKPREQLLLLGWITLLCGWYVDHRKLVRQIERLTNTY